MVQAMLQADADPFRQKKSWGLIPGAEAIYRHFSGLAASFDDTLSTIQYHPPCTMRKSYSSLHLSKKAFYMKVVIVEPDRQVSRKVIRMLQAIDDGIELSGVLRKFDNLQKWQHMHPAPDLVLINRALLSGIRQTVEARLIIPGGTTPLVYLAYRVSNLKHLEKSWLKKKSGTGSADEQDSSLIPVPGRTAADPRYLPSRKRFLVTQQQKYLSVPVEDISYFFSDSRFIFFVTFSNKKYLVEYRIEELENLLDPQEFFRINRSYLVSIRSISLIHPYPGNRFKLTLNPATSKEIIVSRERVPAFRAWLGE